MAFAAFVVSMTINFLLRAAIVINVANANTKPRGQWERHLTTGSRVMTDGLAGFRGIEQAGTQYFSFIITGNQFVQDAVFWWVYTIHGNVKRAVNGTDYAIRPPYVERYLALFQFRSNHRFDLNRMMSKTIRLLVFTKPMVCEKILAEL